MDFSNVKSQVMAMMLMKSGTSDHSYSELWYLIAAVVIISGAEFAFKQFSGLGAKVLERWLPKATTATTEIIPRLDDATKDAFTVTLVRHYDDDRINQPLNENVEKVDAIIEYLSNLDETQHVLLDQRYTIGTDCDIHVEENLSARVKQDPKGSWIEIVLYSDSLKVTEIRAWIDQVHEDYIYEKSNRLGHKTFYFNEIPTEPPRDTTFIREEGADPSEIRWRFDSAPKQLTFTMNEFQTSKSFSNVYGAHVDELRERLNIFINHPEWYEERGIPHTLGIMLHGIPGAGKTSTIKAIAKDTGRHIFNLSLRPYTTCKQLTNLFYDENVAVTAADGSPVNYRIPLNKRIYVIEDIDCLTDVVLDRQGVHSKKQNHNEVLTLSYLLNLLDGVLETPGRILVITSNFPERIDKALIRPGRIDVKVEFRKADRQFILDMLNHFYECHKALADIPLSVGDKFTPAEVMETMCMHFRDPDGALAALKQRVAPQASGTSLDELMALSETASSETASSTENDSESSSIVSQHVRVAPLETPKPTITVGSVYPEWLNKIKPWSTENEISMLKSVRISQMRFKYGDIAVNSQLTEDPTDEELNMLEMNLERTHKVATHEIVEEPDAANGLLPEDLLVDCNADMPVFNDEEMAKAQEQFAIMATSTNIKKLMNVQKIIEYINITASESTGNDNLARYTHANVQNLVKEFPDADMDTIAWALECFNVKPYYTEFKHPLDVRPSKISYP